MRHLRHFAVALAFLTLAPVSVSLAQNKPPEISEADLKKAKEHFKEADKHFRLREFEQAIPDLKEAYRLYPNSLFLYNLAQCHLELKQYEAAVSYFENFIEVDPKSKNRKDAEKYLEQARSALSEEQEKKRQEELARQEQEKLQKMIELEKEKQGQPGPVEKPFYTQRWFKFTAIGVGAAAVVGGGGAIVLSNINRPPKTELGNTDILDR